MRFSVFSLALALVLPSPVAMAQSGRVGAHYGVNLTEGDWEQERLGVQGEVRVAGPLYLSGAFSEYLNFPDATGWTGSARQLHANLRLRARGPLGFASVGYGFLVLHQSLRTDLQSGSVIEVSDSEFADTVVLGVEAPLPYVRPFVDLYLIYLLDRTGQVAVNLLLGLQVPLPMR